MVICPQLVSVLVTFALPSCVGVRLVCGVVVWKVLLGGAVMVIVPVMFDVIWMVCVFMLTWLHLSVARHVIVWVPGGSR